MIEEQKVSQFIQGLEGQLAEEIANMDFGSGEGDCARKLTICGKSNTENNTINIKFFEVDEKGAPTGQSITQVIEFAHTDAYEEKTFEIEPVSGSKKISFVFLPGCNFDFRWFRFEK